MSVHICLGIKGGQDNLVGEFMIVPIDLLGLYTRRHKHTDMNFKFRDVPIYRRRLTPKEIR